MHRLLSYNYLYLLPLLFSAIFSLKSFGLKWPKPYRLFSIFLVFTLLTEVFAIAWKWHLYKTEYWSYNKSNLWIYNAAHILRITLFSWFYYKILQPAPARKIIPAVTLLIGCFGVIDYIFIQTPHKMNTYTLIVTNTWCIFLSMVYFREVLNQKPLIKLTASPMAWISLGSFIYNSGSLPFFIFFNYVFREFLSLAISLLYINHALNIIMYSLYLTAFLCKPHSQK